MSEKSALTAYIISNDYNFPEGGDRHENIQKKTDRHSDGDDVLFFSCQHNGGRAAC